MPDAQVDTPTKFLRLSQADDGTGPAVWEQLHVLFAPKSLLAQLGLAVAAVRRPVEATDVRQLLLETVGGCVVGFLGFRSGRGRCRQ